MRNQVRGGDDGSALAGSGQRQYPTSSDWDDESLARQQRPLVDARLLLLEAEVVVTAGSCALGRVESNLRTPVRPLFFGVGLGRPFPPEVDLRA